MRQFATGLNRTWLAIIGAVLLLAGLAGTAVGTGLLTRSPVDPARASGRAPVIPPSVQRSVTSSPAPAPSSASVSSGYC